MNILKRKLEKSLKKNGLQTTFKNFLNYSNTKFSVRNLTPDLLETLKEKPAIVMSNHPFEAEILALIAACPLRENVRLIINSDFMNFSEELDKYLIPVYVAHHPHEKGRDFFGFIYNTIRPSKTNSKEQAQEKNKKSIATASEFIKNGGMILIFPGKRGINGKWFSGVGHLLKGVGESPVSIINCYIEGTSNLDRLRFIKGIGFLLPEIKATFSKAESFKYQKYDGKEIASLLEEDYNKWVEGIQR